MEESNLGSQHWAAERSNRGGNVLHLLKVVMNLGLVPDSPELQLEEMLYL
jgi:hypothetical protein